MANSAPIDDRILQTLQLEAEQLVHDLVCPHCDSPLIHFVRLIAPKGEKEQTQDAWVGGGVGALAGGALGSVLGPAGTAAGAGAGAWITSKIFAENAATPKAEYECRNCGHSFKRRLNKLAE